MFCQDLVQLIKKDNIKNDERFEKWTNIEGNELNFDYYVDKNLLRENDHNNVNMIIDVKSWKVFREARLQGK